MTDPEKGYHGANTQAIAERMDQESALVYSPGHFTWMDTDHPAGTRRQGYPVEIQALWIEALNLLKQIDASEPADDSDAQRLSGARVCHPVL